MGQRGDLTTADLDDLVRRARCGDSAAWCELSRRYDRDIRHVTRSFRFWGADADDVSQETWITAYRRLVTLRSPSSLPSWLRSIARNECLARLRAARCTPVEDIELDGEVDVVGDVVAAECAGAMHDALTTLGERDRSLVELLLERRPYDEISEVLSMPIGSIGPTRCRIFAKLRRVPALSSLAA